MKNLFGFEMNEEEFANMQKNYPWFDMSLFFKGIPPLDLKDRENKEQLSDIELKQYIFAKIFGSFGLDINLDEAINLCYDILKDIEEYKPKKNHKNENDDWWEWKMEFAAYNVLLGTAFAYKSEYIKATYHFMLGLKTEAIGLNMPYCDFIKYIISKIDYDKIEEQKYEGVGFSVLNFMGSQLKKTQMLF